MRELHGGGQTHKNTWTATTVLPRTEWEKMSKDFINDGLVGWEIESEQVAGDEARIIYRVKPNLVVNSGVNNGLDRLYGLGGSALITMGVDNGASNPVAGTTSSTSGSSSRRLVSFDSTPVRSNQTVTSIGTFTNSNVAFIMKRLFLSRASAGTTDAAGDLYAMTNVFTIDLTSFSTWSQTFQATTTGSGS